jgi:transketolase
MLNPEAKLNPKMFDEDIEQKPTRDGYGTGLVLAGEADKNIVAICADLTESTRVEAFAKKFPERYVEVGVAEQNMAAIAAGMAVTNKVPFIASYATFSPGRNWEQIRTTIAYNDANVKIAGHHAGISVGPDGATHQATEDIAIMRAMPNMRVFVPCDAIEAEKATLAAAHIYGPVYLRFQREKTPIMTTAQTPFTPGGGLLYNALLAARELEKEKIGAIVLNCHTIKPLDEKKIVELAKKAGAVVTVEEHQIQGGLGGAVAECLARNEPTSIEFIGMQNTFGESGAPDKLIEKYGMGVADIKKAAKKALRRK